MESLVKLGQGRELGIAASYIAILIVMGVVLAFRVIAVRRSQRIGIGSGDNRLLERRIRCHGNFTEYAPFLIAILILLPLLGAREWMIHAAGVLGVTGRILHAVGLGQSAGTTFGRLAGMILTFTVMILGAIAILVLAWR